MNILFIVERNFLQTHVGVRRVICHYMDDARRMGHAVEVGHWHDGRIFKGQMTTHVQAAQGHGVHTSYWSSEGSLRKINAPRLPVLESRVKWTTDTWEDGDFDRIVVTNPWLCAHGIKPLPRSIGIVYDLVPNLLAANAIRFGIHQDVYGFAYQHNLGFEYFREHCEKVICISQSTRNDLLSVFAWDRSPDDVLVDIPFKPMTAPETTLVQQSSVLLVNALDWRKNVNGILRVLKACKPAGARVSIVGHERISQNEARRFMSGLANSGYLVDWYRDADESLLQHLYCTSELLFFPSLYEGLGLPVLEAQAMGLPAVSTDISSCQEINMNPSLTFSPDDEAGMIDRVGHFLSGQKPPDVLSGQALIQAQDQYLSVNARGIFS
jgi:glycosyltransferase involved in cell wall biosynthesis